MSIVMGGRIAIGGRFHDANPPALVLLLNLWLLNLLVLNCTELAAVSPVQLAQYTGKLARRPREEARDGTLK